SANLRQGRTPAPNPQKMAYPSKPGPHRGPPTSPARSLPRLLQLRAPAPRARPSHPPTGIPRPPQSDPDRHSTTRRRLPHPPRPHRHQRQPHRAPHQPPTPHRHGPQTRRHPRPAVDPRPTHPDRHHRRPTTTRTATRPDEKLPTTNQTVNDVPRHMCTMSRDITLVELRGIEPLTFSMRTRRATNCAIA